MSLGVVRGKESSNRIELSRLVQDLLNLWCFGLPAALGRGQVGGHVWGICRHGGVPTHVHMHAHICTCMHMQTHTCTCMHMYRNCKWPPTWRHPCLSCLLCLTCMCMCACMHACACACVHAWDTPLHTHIHPHSHPPSATPQGDPRISQNSITLELIKIFQFCLKI